jgi:hypothetical protein
MHPFQLLGHIKDLTLVCHHYEILEPIASHTGSWWEELYEEGLLVTAGMELMERSQACGFHMFDVFDTIPLILFQPLQ